MSSVNHESEYAFFAKKRNRSKNKFKKIIQQINKEKDCILGNDIIGMSVGIKHKEVIHNGKHSRIIEDIVLQGEVIIFRLKNAQGRSHINFQGYLKKVTTATNSFHLKAKECIAECLKGTSTDIQHFHSWTISITSSWTKTTKTFLQSIINHFIKKLNQCLMPQEVDYQPSIMEMLESC